MIGRISRIFHSQFTLYIKRILKHFLEINLLATAIKKSYIFCINISTKKAALIYILKDEALLITAISFIHSTAKTITNGTTGNTTNNTTYYAVSFINNGTQYSTGTGTNS